MVGPGKYGESAEMGCSQWSNIGGIAVKDDVVRRVFSGEGVSRGMRLT
jgi:hypothetical protein